MLSATTSASGVDEGLDEVRCSGNRPGDACRYEFMSNRSAASSSESMPPTGFVNFVAIVRPPALVLRDARSQRQPPRVQPLVNELEAACQRKGLQGMGQRRGDAWAPGGSTASTLRPASGGAAFVRHAFSFAPAHPHAATGPRCNYYSIETTSYVLLVLVRL